MERELGTIFASKGLRLTQPRRKVFAAMHESDAPLSIAAIVKQCPDNDRTSVYRTISLFVDMNIAESVPVGWKQRYELTSPFKRHHHHLTCQECGFLIDIESQNFEQLVDSITQKFDFLAKDHTLEIRGVCGDCQKRKRGETD